MTDTPAQEFREIGGRFGDVAAGVRPDQWDDPSPVEELDGARRRPAPRRVVPVVPGGRRRRASCPAGPVGRRRPGRPPGEHLQTEVQALLDDPASADRVLEQPAHR